MKLLVKCTLGTSLVSNVKLNDPMVWDNVIKKLSHLCNGKIITPQSLKIKATQFRSRTAHHHIFWYILWNLIGWIEHNNDSSHNMSYELSIQDKET
jgi:hypothetical protein